MLRIMIGILVLSLMACTSNAPVPTPLPTRASPDPTQPSATEALLPTQALTATVSRIQDCPNAPSIQLIVQERGQVIDNGQSLNLRRGPGTNYPVVTRIEPGETFIVLDGPACASDFTWFRVRYDDEDHRFFEGWLAEGDAEQYYVSPYLPG